MTDVESDESLLESLLERVAEGDRRAFDVLYDVLAPRVLGVAYRVLRVHGLAEEVAQEVFLEIWQRAARFDRARGGAVTWALTLAHRRAVDRVRSAQAARDRDLRIGARDWRPDYDHVAESAEIRSDSARVASAMSRLTDVQRHAVSLAYHGGYSHREISELLAVPLGTVKTRIRDGLIRLRDELGVASEA